MLAPSLNSAKVASTAKRNMTLFKRFTKFVKDLKCKFGKHKFDTWITTSNGKTVTECSHCKLRQSGMWVKRTEYVWNKNLCDKNILKDLDKHWKLGKFQ